MSHIETLLLKIPRNSTITPEATQTFLSALTNINYRSKWGQLFGRGHKPFALEIVFQNGQIGFYIVCDSELKSFIETQLQSAYPLVVIEKVDDYLNTANNSKSLSGGEQIPPQSSQQDFEIGYLKVTKGNYYSIALWNMFNEVDPLSNILTVMSKEDPKNFIIVQFAIEAMSDTWQKAGEAYADRGVKNADGSYSARHDQAFIKEKIKYPGFEVSIRIGGSNKKVVSDLANSFGVFANPNGNLFNINYPHKFNKKGILQNLKSRKVVNGQILNLPEIATLWHLPNDKIKVPGVIWGKNVFSEPPENLPVAGLMSEEEREHTNFFARTQFRNQEVVFGIKDADRLRHVWVIGKTGTGKSTLLENMAVDDFKKGRGVAFLDPHGDSSQALLNYIPKSRINDVVYFDPADRDFPISINPLEVTNREEAELVVSGLMAIFTKLWQGVWSARMEYILRNAFLTLTEVPGSTLEDCLRLLNNQSYRNKVLQNVTDHAILNFWREEFDKMDESFQKEAIAPIQNKVGQFVTSPLIRRIISVPKSSVSLDEVMDGHKILIANLSQGRLGEDNAALLGAMLITKFQQAAMRRINADRATGRQPFYLYVDEFQNFATTSFIKILSEARKFGLGLTLANQFMAQIPPEIQKAILGNAGSMISFGIGAEDAGIVHKEFAEVFEQGDLVNLQNRQIAIKLMIDGHTTRPFVAYTLPPSNSMNQNKEKVIRVSRERYARKVKEASEPNTNDQPLTTEGVFDNSSNSELQEADMVSTSPEVEKQ